MMPFVPKLLSDAVLSNSPVYIGKEMFREGHPWLSHVTGKKCVLVSNTRVYPLYGKGVHDILTKCGVDVYPLILRDGEEYKTFSSALQVLNHAIKVKLDRSCTFISLGGGVISDITGFAASIYQRGVPVVHIPTTLMAMVDASIGGKTAVNHAAAKNIIGTFHTPACVVMDVATLSTLPRREYVSGIAEMIKHGLIYDSSYFSWLEKHMPDLLHRKETVLMDAIRRSCHIKCALVEMDERDETGVRALLNLGHTFGHALETLTNYSAYLHGEAVAIGIVAAAQLSLKIGYINADLNQRVLGLIERAGLPTHVAENDLIKYGITADKMYETMISDKKTVRGVINLVLMRGQLGNAVLTNDYKNSDLMDCLRSFCRVST